MKKTFLSIILISIGIFSVLYFSNKSNTNISFNKFQKKNDLSETKADEPNQFAQYFKDITTKIGEKESGYKMNYQIEEFKKAMERLKSLNYKNKTLSWVQRGPANVSGRTRAIIVDPDDLTHKTWFVGAATGGVWKTTDGGLTWTDLSGALTNMAVCAFEMSESNHDILYAGTGEIYTGNGFKGTGIWKSTDRGNNWTQLAATATDENFAYINRLVINPTDDNIVLAATQNGIYKTNDGGTTWTNVYSTDKSVDDITADPVDFNNLFAGVNTVGIIRSTDAGNTWVTSSDGIGAGKRFEVTVSDVNHNYVFTSVEVSDTESGAYFSDDNGLTWKKFNDTQNFLGGQGWYDNAVTAHPYNADEVFVGGVDIWKLKFNGTESTSSPSVLRAYTENTSFLSFINFGRDYLGGGMSTDDGTSIISSDWTSVEVRFGPGLTQKAHRFTVPSGSTSGVPASSYTYLDYIDVPFQVWDTENNIQLMVSFRDQEADGEFNLYERTGDAYGELGREYIFVNAVPYSTTPDANIATSGGHLYKSLYMFWPTLKVGETWNSSNLPSSKIVVKYGSVTLITGEKTSIADSYGHWGGPNGYNQNAGYGQTSIPGLHPDHHNITIIPTGNPNFIMIDGNDGGIGVSYDNGVTLDEIPDNYITTQFYGVAKNPLENQYIGGMQDNGTWQSQEGEETSNTSQYLFRLGGDGFECLWNAENPNFILGSLYNNRIYRSTNKGQNWSSTSGITSNDGPFITKLSGSKEDPNTVFAVGYSGVYKSVNFGQNWTKKTISQNWGTANNYVPSSYDVKVSLANGKVVWAGGGMATDYNIQLQVSTDYGNTFTAVPDFSDVQMNAYISGIETHPVNSNTAYILFSLPHSPKILRTNDLGQTWEDISGFGTGTQSTNGFPDVVAHCLLVMPNDTNTIWVGTDIGLFESTDNGTSWQYANNGLPPVSVYDMKIIGNQLIVATHGRGIWTVDLPEVDNMPYISSFTESPTDTLQIVSDFKVNYDSVEVFINDIKDTTYITPPTGINTLEIDMDVHNGNYQAYIIGYISPQSYQSNTVEYTASGILELSDNIGSVKVYPNPSSGIFSLEIDNSIDKFNIRIYDIKGQLVYSNNMVNNEKNILNLSFLSEGTYFMKVNSDKKQASQIILIKK